MLPHFRVACRSVELVGDVKLYEVASINNPIYRIEQNRIFAPIQNRYDNQCLQLIPFSCPHRVQIMFKIFIELCCFLRVGWGNKFKYFLHYEKLQLHLYHLNDSVKVVFGRCTYQTLTSYEYAHPPEPPPGIQGIN